MQPILDAGCSDTRCILHIIYYILVTGQKLYIVRIIEYAKNR